MSSDPPSVRPDGFSKRPRPKRRAAESVPDGPTRDFERPPGSSVPPKKIRWTQWLLLALGLSLGLNLWQAGQIRGLLATETMWMRNGGTGNSTPAMEVVAPLLDTGFVEEEESLVVAAGPTSMIDREFEIDNRGGPSAEVWLYLQQVEEVRDGVSEAPSSSRLANEIVERARNEEDYTDIDTYQVALLRQREALELVLPPSSCEQVHNLILLEIRQGEGLLESLMQAEIEGQDSPALDLADQRAASLLTTHRQVENMMLNLRRGEQDGLP